MHVPERRRAQRCTTTCAGDEPEVADDGGRGGAARRVRCAVLRQDGPVDTMRTTQVRRRSKMSGTLHGIRVLDLTHEPGFFAGKLLGDLGADVVKVEPPGGDPARRRPPFWGGVADPDRSLLWLAMNTSKRGITLDLDRPRGREILLDLVRRADVLVETPDGADRK